MTDEKNNEIAAQAELIIRLAYIELLRRYNVDLLQHRAEVHKSRERPGEVICPRLDLPGFLYEKDEPRTKIYEYLIEKDYIKLDDSTDELYCFVLTENGKKHAQENLFPKFDKDSIVTR